MASFSSVVAAILLCAALANASWTNTVGTTPTPPVYPTQTVPTTPNTPNECIPYPVCPPVTCRCPPSGVCPKQETECLTVVETIDKFEETQVAIETAISVLKEKINSMTPMCGKTIVDICHQYNVDIDFGKAHLTNI